MAHEPQSLYAILGVDRDARSTDIERAYRRIKAEMQKETTPPDARLRVLVEHAHDVLMDPVRREEYDKEMRSPAARLQEARRSPRTLVLASMFVVAAAAAAWFATRTPSAPSAPIAKPRQEVQNAVAMAVGRVHRIQLSGEKAPLGLAFAIAEGTLVTSCEGLSPNAELVVRFGKREAPVRPSATPGVNGLCRLVGGTVGSWPLALAQAARAAADGAYVVRLDGTGGARLVDTRVKGIARVGGDAAYEAQAPIDPASLGAPLIDLDGRVLGAASEVQGHRLYVPVPPLWVNELTPPPAPPKPAPEPEEVAPPPPSGEPIHVNPNISPERRQRLEKAFRPPPTVPPDL